MNWCLENPRLEVPGSCVSFWLSLQPGVDEAATCTIDPSPHHSSLFIYIHSSIFIHRHSSIAIHPSPFIILISFIQSPHCFLSISYSISLFRQLAEVIGVIDTYWCFNSIHSEPIQT
jgi:hypothetical protein